MNLEKIFNSFNNLNILVVGDVMVDSYLWGKIERISPEAPVPVLSVKKREKRLGGAANVLLNLKSLGATPHICSVIGYDKNGEDFVQLLKNENINTENLIISKNRPTTIKHRIIGETQHILRIDEESTSPINKKEEDELLTKFNNLLATKKIDAIIFQDYNKGVLTKNVITTTINLAQKLNIPTVVDPKKDNFFEYKNVSLFKPNKKELLEGLKLESLDTNDELIDAFTELQKKIHCDSALITLSEKGVFIGSTKYKTFIPAHKRNIIDVSGAGDTVVSVATLCVALGLENDIIAKLSNLAGGLVCEHIGVVNINKSNLYKEAKELFTH